jgi:Arc/MetJ family transcription regulator
MKAPSRQISRFWPGGRTDGDNIRLTIEDHSAVEFRPRESQTNPVNGQPMMRTTIDIDEDLMVRAQGACGTRTRKATIEEALRPLIRLREQEEVLGLAGKVRWKGNLDESRRGRTAE